MPVVGAQASARPEPPTQPRPQVPRPEVVISWTPPFPTTTVQCLARVQAIHIQPIHGDRQRLLPFPVTYARLRLAGLREAVTNPISFLIAAGDPIATMQAMLGGEAAQDAHR